MIRTTVFRVIFAFLVPVILAFGLRYLYLYGNTEKYLPRCVIYAITGKYCPGCGSGRSSYALLHGHWLTALHKNVMFVILLPVVIYFLLKTYLDIVFAKEILPGFNLSYMIMNTAVGVLIIYTILRNIPYYPFYLLAP
jgi:hypothetical protein